MNGPQTHNMPELRRIPRTKLTDTSSKSSRYSEESYESQSTAPTSLYESPRPSLQHAATAPIYHKASYEADTDSFPLAHIHERASTETYASTLASDLDLCDEPEPIDEYEVPPHFEVEYEADSYPSEPQEFASLFPSMRRMVIRHDGRTTDRNMNLRIETPVTEGGRKTYIQLFHLRMQDLKKREFSLRRYCRDSGREVCHSIRRYKTPSEKPKSTLQSSVSHALATLVKPDFKRQNSAMSTMSRRSTKSASSYSRRKDSGYGSDHNDEELDDDDFATFMDKAKQSNIQLPTNTTNLEFSNYAQVQVKRRGAKAGKRYEFEYWGHKYTWKRVEEKGSYSAVKPISFHLIRGEGGEAIAHIVPEPLSRYDAQIEAEAGGWVPPCSMWISNSSVIDKTDVAEVIVSTGLIALVDDCIKRRWHRLERRVHEIRVPLTPLRMEMEYVGPKALVEHMFKRRNSGGQSRMDEHQRRSPLRQASAIETH